jgi:hypothetical protein
MAITIMSIVTITIALAIVMHKIIEASSIVKRLINVIMMTGSIVS